MLEEYRLATPVIQPRMHFFDKDGMPLVGGKVYSYKVGEDDEFKPTYRNSELTAANQNPILLDQAGSCLIYMRGSVELRVFDKNGVFIETKIVYQQQEQAQFFDKLGKPLANGKVWTYDYQSTLQKTSYYADAAANPNPVLLDENGKATLYMAGAYRLRQFDKNNVFVSDQDFKRQPAKVLTSKPYPAYSYESVSVKPSLLMSKDYRLIYSETSSEFTSIDIAIQNAKINDIENKIANYDLESLATGRFDLDALQTTFAVTNVKIINPLNTANHIDYVELNPSVKSATIKDVLLIQNQPNEDFNIEPSIVSASISLDVDTDWVVILDAATWDPVENVVNLSWSVELR